MNTIGNSISRPVGFTPVAENFNQAAGAHSVKSSVENVAEKKSSFIQKLKNAANKSIEFVNQKPLKTLMTTGAVFTFIGAVTGSPYALGVGVGLVGYSIYRYIKNNKAHDLQREIWSQQTQLTQKLDKIEKEPACQSHPAQLDELDKLDKSVKQAIQTLKEPRAKPIHPELKELPEKLDQLARHIKEVKEQKMEQLAQQACQ